jgi:hypothetical protein
MSPDAPEEKRDHTVRAEWESGPGGVIVSKLRSEDIKGACDGFGVSLRSTATQRYLMNTRMS